MSDAVTGACRTRWFIGFRSDRRTCRRTTRAAAQEPPKWVPYLLIMPLRDRKPPRRAVRRSASTDIISPSVSVAVLCRNAERDDDGLISIHGIHEGFRLRMRALPRAVAVQAVVVVHGGHMLGVHRVGLRLMDPLGTIASDHLESRHTFKDAAAAISTIDRFVIHPSIEGVYRLEVLFDDQPLLRRPVYVGLTTTP
jgi:hypothetical protein